MVTFSVSDVFPSIDYESDYGEILASQFLYYHVFYVLFLKNPFTIY